MCRWLYISVVSSALGAVFLLTGLVAKSGHAKVSQPVGAKSALTYSQEPLKIKAVQWGPTQAAINAASSAVIRHPAVQHYLRGTRYRKLAFELVDPGSKAGASLTPPSGYRVTFYDYTNNRAIIAEGSFKRPGVLWVSQEDVQPPPSHDEFVAAKRILAKDSRLGPSIRNGTLKTYHPMPPVLYPHDTNDRVERTIMVGLMGGAGHFGNQIVGVNMVRQTVVRFEGGAPRASMATAETCGIPEVDQPTTLNGTAGQYQVTVNQGTTELWSFLAIRPSASSGNSFERSGIELRDVKYRGKLVLNQGHVPVLNVRYDNDTCGPFRDWQWQEGMFQADGTDIAPGFRMCPTPAMTSLETGDDSGNFRGVAIYTQGTETVLVTEMNAGWYRYIMEWRLDVDGTIRPRFGFGGVSNSCVCIVHHHHVYWRFDFDIDGPDNNAVYETSPEGFWTPPALKAEAKRYRNLPNLQTWTVKNLKSGDSYALVPGPADGTAFGDSFARGDLWILQYRSDEIDDPNTSHAANIDAWVNGEPVASQDIVIWYAAHFDHDEGADIAPLLPRSLGDAPNILTGDHVVGPDIIPLKP